MGQNKKQNNNKEIEDQVEFKVSVPNDGTPIELVMPKGFNFFISKKGLPFVNKIVHKVTYEEIANTLFKDGEVYYNSGNTIYKVTHILFNIGDYDNCTSEKQVRRLLAYNKLQNIAKYLNGPWKVDKEYKRGYCIVLDDYHKKPHPIEVSCYNTGLILFKDEKAAKEAIRIMGEEAMNDYLSTDW